jgi:N6-adenosine-specific RNA methylase IME4
MSWPFAPLQMFGYDVIEIDCPWLFGLRSKKGEAKSAQAKYECMSLADIQALPVGHLARAKAVLLLWATIPMLPQAIETLLAFGAVYKSNMVWRKVTVNGKVRWGTGYRAMGGHEHVLIGCFGQAQIHQRFLSIFDGVAREHSRKPTEFYEHVRDRTPNLSRCSLFSRESHPGFDGWGFEHGKFNPVAAQG